MVYFGDLQHYHFFEKLTDVQLRKVAALAEEITVEKGTILFDEDNPADKLCLLMEGGVDLYCVSGTERELEVGGINVGEVFGLSALIEPYKYHAAARVSARSRILKVDATGLRALCAADLQLAYYLVHGVARAAMERLYSTQILLAAEGL